MQPYHSFGMGIDLTQHELETISKQEMVLVVPTVCRKDGAPYWNRFIVAHHHHRQVHLSLARELAVHVLAIVPFLTISLEMAASVSDVSSSTSGSGPTTVDRSNGERLTTARRLETLINKWQTRVLRLHAGKHGEALTADLLVADIVTFDGLVLRAEQESVSYEAISYYWGQPTFIHPIRCNGITVYITPTLHEALKRFRPVKCQRVHRFQC